MYKLWSVACDWLWVIKAYLRGKVLRQKMYRPQGEPCVFRAPPNATARRVVMLMRLWGYRPPTVDEAQELFKQQVRESPRVPFVVWDDENKRVRLESDWNNLDDWNQPHRFATVRKY